MTRRPCAIAFFAMPSAAIETHMVSQVLSLEEIPGAIVAHTMRA